MKKQLVQFNFPNMTERQYDQVWDELRKAGLSNPSGLVHHAAGFQGKNCLVTDTWESVEAFEKLGKVLMPILDKLGIQSVQPTITPIYYEYSSVEEHATH